MSRLRFLGWLGALWLSDRRRMRDLEAARAARVAAKAWPLCDVADCPDYADVHGFVCAAHNEEFYGGASK